MTKRVKNYWAIISVSGLCCMALWHSFAPAVRDGTGSHANVSEFLNAQAEMKAHQHAMRRLGQSVSDARRMYNEFVGMKLEDALIDAHQAKVEMQRGSKEKAHVFMTAALISIGMAQHPVADSTSPAHSGFTIWTNGKIPVPGD